MGERWDETEIERAAEILRRGGLVAFPTETVYGLGADARNPAAVRRIFQAKGRPANHPLIVHLPGPEHLGRWAARVPPEAERLAARFWPGPLTMILPRGPGVLLEVTGGRPAVGLRVPRHPLVVFQQHPSDARAHRTQTDDRYLGHGAILKFS